MFSGLRQNSIFYVLDKSDALKLKIGQVTSVSNPVPKYNQGNIGGMFGQQGEMVVDVSIKVGDETMDFKQLPANLSVASMGHNIVVSESKEAMNNEVEALLRNSRLVLESVPYHEKLIASCDDILRELNPQFAKEKAQEEKIGALEERMGGIEGTLGSIQKMLSDALSRESSVAKKKE